VPDSVEYHPITATTDPAGRFCLTLPLEHNSVLIGPHRVVSDRPIDPRFAGSAGQRLLATARAGDDMHDAQPARFPILVRSVSTAVSTIVGNYSVAAWRPSRDQSPHCSALRRPAPWYHYKGLGSQWQAYLLLILPPVAFVLIVAGLLVRRARRELLIAGVATLVISIPLTAVLLDIPRGERYVPNPPWLYQT
jgi:hypothetical protein